MTTADQHRARAGEPSLGFALITASDSRTSGDDRSGALARELIVTAGHRVESATLVRDEAPAIRAAAEGALGDPAVDLVLISGGTGLAPRDVSIEAVAPLFDKEIDGFGELFRRLSYDEIGAAAMLSRACAGIVGERVLFCLPGSPAAVRLAIERLILPEAGHLLDQVRRSDARPHRA